MGGSSPPPSDLPGKTGRRRKSELEAERWARMHYIRMELQACRRCVEMWQAAPALNLNRIHLAVSGISRSIQREEDSFVRQELETNVEDRMRAFLDKVERNGGDRETMKAYLWVYLGWKQAYRLERIRQR